MPISPLVDQTLDAIVALDQEAMAAARARQDTLTKQAEVKAAGPW